MMSCFTLNSSPLCSPLYKDKGVLVFQSRLCVGNAGFFLHSSFCISHRRLLRFRSASVGPLLHIFCNLHKADTTVLTVRMRCGGSESYITCPASPSYKASPGLFPSCPCPQVLCATWRALGPLTGAGDTDLLTS